MEEPKKLNQSNLFATVSTPSDVVSEWGNICISVPTKTTFYASLSCELTKLIHFNAEVESVQ